MSVSVSFLNEEVSKCFHQIVLSLSDVSYDEKLESIASYLMNQDDTTFDNIVEQFPMVNKPLLFNMLLANFLEIYQHRKQKNVSFDWRRKEIYNALVVGKQIPNSVISISPTGFKLLLNDDLTYFYHRSPFYKKHIYGSFSQEELELVTFYNRLTSLSYLLSFMIPADSKEEFYYTLIESISDSIDALLFAANETNSPIFMPHYIESSIRVLEELDKSKLEKNKFYCTIIKELKSLVNASTDDNKKYMMLELIFAGVSAKDQSSLTPFEKKLKETLISNHMNCSFLKNFYDQNEDNILTTFLFQFSTIKPEIQLQNFSLFDEVCNRNGNQYRKK